MWEKKLFFFFQTSPPLLKAHILSFSRYCKFQLSLDMVVSIFPQLFVLKDDPCEGSLNSLFFPFNFHMMCVCLALSLNFKTSGDFSWLKKEWKKVTYGKSGSQWASLWFWLVTMCIYDVSTILINVCILKRNCSWEHFSSIDPTTVRRVFF